MALKTIGPLPITQLLPNTSTDGIASLVLVANTAQAVAIPTGARIAAFAFNIDIWVAFGANTAIVPSSFTSAGSTQGCEFNPTIRFFGGTAATTAISVVADSTGKGQISFFT